MKILICEDDKDILELIKLLVSQLSYEVDGADSIKGIRNLISKNNYNLMIIDYWLHGETAESIIKEVQADERFENTKLVLISAINNLEDIAKNLGIHDTIKKPFDIVQFQNKIQALLKS